MQFPLYTIRDTPYLQANAKNSNVHSWLMGSCLLLFTGIPTGQAEFNLNFRPDDGNYSFNDAYVSCGMSYISNANCSTFGGFNLNGSHDDNTAFYQRMFTDGSGNTYYQVIVGDYLVDDFAMEYIIKANASVDGTWNQGIARSASAGDPNDRLYNMNKPYDTADTIPTSSGTGTGNPTRILVHQVLSDNEINLEYLKDTFANKPLITQSTDQAGEMTSYFAVDMRNKTYSDNTAIDPSLIAITATFAAAFGDSGNFDISTDREVGNNELEASTYTYTPGTNYGESNGLYNYVNPSYAFQPSGIDYSSFCDTTQNTDWSGNGACTNSDGTGGGRNRGGTGGGGWGW